MPFKSRYNLYKFAHCKIPIDQYERLKKIAGKDYWAETVRDLIEQYLEKMEDKKP